MAPAFSVRSLLACHVILAAAAAAAERPPNILCRATIDQPVWQLYDLPDDPGETRDLAGQRRETVAKLESAYRRWWSEVRGGWDPPHRIEVGHTAHNPVTLNAPQAVRWDGLGFAGRIRDGRPANPGFAHDWLTGWTSTEARAQWTIEVASAGDYRVSVLCNVRPQDAGARIRVTAAGASAEGVTRAFPGEPVPLRNLDERSRNRYLNRTWDTQPIGTLRLPAGSATLAVQAISMPGAAVMDLKGVRLEKTTDNHGNSER